MSTRSTSELNSFALSPHELAQEYLERYPMDSSWSDETIRDKYYWDRTHEQTIRDLVESPELRITAHVIKSEVLVLSPEEQRFILRKRGKKALLDLETYLEFFEEFGRWLPLDEALFGDVPRREKNMTDEEYLEALDLKEAIIRDFLGRIDWKVSPSKPETE